MAVLRNKIMRETILFDDENSPSTSSYDVIWPKTILDAVFDQLDPREPTLRELLKELDNKILTGGQGSIVFPVTSVNGQQGEVVITKTDIGLSRVNNTDDMEKPLSTPQRNAVMSILATYDFNIDLSELRGHITDYNNPHRITVDQLNTNGEITAFINNLISIHNNSSSTHSVIWNEINKISTIVNNIDTSYDDRITSILDGLTDHITSATAHELLLSKKENSSNKVSAFSRTTNNTTYNYPSTQAVIDFIDVALQEFVPDAQVDEYISDIIVVPTDTSLPVASKDVYRKMYLIRNRANTNFSAVAVCRKTGNDYHWETSNFQISKYNPAHFIETLDGLSIDWENNNPGHSYTQSEADARFIRAVQIGTGTDNGTISYMLNNDLSTRVDNVAVKGLGTLSYKSNIGTDDIVTGAVTGSKIDYGTITNFNIADNTINHANIMNLAIRSNHIFDGAVTSGKIGPSAVSTSNISAGAVQTPNIGNGAVTNEKMNNMPAKTVKANLLGTAAPPQDVPISEVGGGGVLLTTNANKPAGDANKLWIPTDGTYQGIGHYWYNNAWVPMRSVAM